jgi:phage anti-repressor protein
VQDWVAESISDFCLVENQNFVVLPHLWIKGEPRIRAFREPRGQISGSYLAEERQLLVPVRSLRLFAVKHEIPYRKWLEALQERGIASEITYKSLTAGTDIPCAQGPMVTIDMTHESLAGANKNISVDPERQESNVTPLRR